MSMNRQNYLEMIIAFLTRLKKNTGFNLETPLDHNSRIKLSAIANSAENMGEKDIGIMIQKALSSNDPKTQEILLYSGISKGPLSDNDIISALTLASNKLQSMGGNPDNIAAQALEPSPSSGGNDNLSDVGDEDPLSSLLGDDGVDQSSDSADGDPLADLLGDEEPSDENDDGEEDNTDSKENDDEPSNDDEETDGRIAKEGDDEELEEVPEPSPMNDWFNRFVLD